MRIISGSCGGRTITPPKNLRARPTTDFAKENLFNVLGNVVDFEGIEVLDLFAGTGGIGLEFVSRGAREVTAVEMAHTQQNFIISCCKQLGIRNLHLIRGDVFKFVKTCHVQYDFIYADPPYNLDLLPTVPDLVFEQGILKENGYFVLEHSKEHDFSQHPHFVEQRSYGSVHFSFFQ
jgi:16S rRNA (guanine(966)-N(2))-methyltransferase RsmD